MSNAAMEVHRINQDAARIRAIAAEIRDGFGCLAHSNKDCKICKVSSCECDADCDQDGFFRISHYCPLHDDCESCGERLGVAKDPAFPNVYSLTRIKRPFWMCQQCLDEQCSVCGMDLEGGCNGHDEPEERITDPRKAVRA